MNEDEIGLTTRSSCAGCAAKLGPGPLTQILRPLREQVSPLELLVGLTVADDAAVWRVAPDRAIVSTIDFFPPIVDGARASGAIAAANAMSDVYAMGGEVLFALNVAAWPDDLPLEQLERIFAGAVERVKALPASEGDRKE